MAIRCETLRTAGYIKRTSHGTTGEECCICGRQTAGLAGAVHVAIDHTCSEFVTDTEALLRGDDCSLFPIGPECVRKWRKAIGADATRSRLRRAGGEIIAYAHTST